MGLDRRLEFSDVDYRYRRSGAPLLSGLSCRLTAGEVVHVGGRNGVGKSTLLRLAAGLLTPSSGKISRTSGRVGYVPAALDISPVISTGQFLRTCAQVVSARESYEAVVDHLDLAPALALPVANLSSGTRQRVNLAQGIMGRPDLLVLDEPFAAVDAHYLHIVADALRAQARRGTAILFAEHAADAVAEMCPTRRLVLQNGALTKSPTPGPSVAHALVRVVAPSTALRERLMGSGTQREEGLWHVSGDPHRLQTLAVDVIAADGELVEYSSVGPVGDRHA